MQQLSKRTWIEIIVGLVTVVVFSAVLMVVLNNQPSALDTKVFTSYEDCAGNGGVVKGGDISICLGSNEQVFLQYSAQNLPRINERKANTAANQVTADKAVSADLVAFLKQDYTGCEPTGYYTVVKEVPSRFALMEYGCVGEPQDSHSKIIAMKLADGWALLSPTNNMRDDGTPSCLLVDMFKVSSQISAKCFESTGYNDGNLRDVTYE